MVDPLTYLGFHAVFLLPPLLGLAGAALWRYELVALRRRHVGVVVLMCLLALVYTSPWDNFLIGLGVWSYGPDRLSVTLGNVPLGEYLFFVLQPLLTSLWLAHVGNDVVSDVRQGTRAAVIGLFAGAVVGLVGLAALSLERTLYLGAILTWAAPVLALQWAVGWRYLWQTRYRVATAVLVPTAYLGVADAVALSQGLWRINPQFIVGLSVGVVPIEELTFFLATNLFVVQGLVLFPWVWSRVTTDLPVANRNDAERPRWEQLRGVVRRWR